MGADQSNFSYNGNNYMNVLPYIGLTPVPREEIFLRPVPVLDLVRDAPAVFLLVRRPGCNMCREAAADLSALKPQFDRLGVRVYAVVHERKGINGFLQYFRGDGLFLDEQKAMFNQVLGGHTKSLFSALFGNAQANSDRAEARGFKGDMKGKYDLMGGLVILGAGPTGIVYKHNEKEFGDHAPLPEVVAAASRVGRGAALAPSPFAAPLSPKFAAPVASPSYLTQAAFPTSPYSTFGATVYPAPQAYGAYGASAYTPTAASKAVFNYAPTSYAPAASPFSSPFSPAGYSYANSYPISPSYPSFGASMSGIHLGGAPVAPAQPEVSDCGEEACAMPRRR